MSAPASPRSGAARPAAARSAAARSAAARPAATLSAGLVAWFRRHRRDLPWRRDRDPYRVWVSEIMLQQTTVGTVVPYFERFVRRFPTVRRLARARPASVLAAWSGLGYYGRARRLHAAARLVMTRHAGNLPDDRDALLSLPGIGRYTAGAILSIAFGRPEPILDGNVTRLIARLLGERRDPRRTGVAARLWEEARRLVESSGTPGDLNEALMEIGATVCTPTAPSCGVCPVAGACAARAAGRQGSIPPVRRRRAAVRVRQRVALVRRGGRLLMRRRQGTGLLDGLWEFPAIETIAGVHRLEEDGPPVDPLARRGTLRHGITYRRLEVEVLEAALLAEPEDAGYRWVRPADARRMPISSLVGKILKLACDAPRPSRAGTAV